MVATTAGISPYITTTAAGTFNAQSAGYIQGEAMPDPAARNELSGGVLAQTETLPMWGGVGISELIPGVAGGPSSTLGSLITRATTITAGAAGSLTGFSVFDQNHAAINSPQSPVPTSGSGGPVHFYRFGSNVRIAVACAPSLVSLDGSIVTSQVSWDFGAQQLVPYNAAYPANVITAASYSATAPGSLSFTTTTAHTVAVGEYFTISGMLPIGYNGTFLAVTGTTGSTLVGVLPNGATMLNPGASTTQGTLVAGGGALPVRVLDVAAGNSMVVTYNPVTNFTSWLRTGTCALILI